MKFRYSLVALAALFAAVAASNYHPLSDEYIAEINRKQSTWKAGRNFEVDEWDKFKAIATGALKLPKSKLVQLKQTIHDESTEIPEYFDAAEQWPNCESIREIRDQSRCGACWAFAAVEAMSDRICIHSGQTKQVRISSQDLLTCCNYCGFGCDGGFTSDAWLYWKRDGIVTGGLFNRTDEGCVSYFLPECDDHPAKCRDYVDTPACVQRCDNPNENYESSLTFGSDVNYFSSEKQIQLEILKNGPVETQYYVYEDFASYQSGIYQQTSNVMLGGHAVKIVGWGVEDGVKYWKIANSWNPRWGEDGYFRIIRGVNSCGIEESVVASVPIFN
ncbi:cathepsin B-like [Cylas formicarius]|uniref:cathepsin B-like n=1 Tax=Cylas formicarius TaxID=197179 RepID=UPI002958AF35|nr:cathepsin B-like [Cylas formicarius]